METAITKKHVGTGFIYLFAVLFINGILVRIPVAPESILWDIRVYYVNLLLIPAIAYIAFSRKCQSSLPAKIGGAMYVLYAFWIVMEILAVRLTGEGIVKFPSMAYSHISYFVFYALAVLLFAWGSKLWLPSKIAYTASVLTSVFCYVMGNIVLFSAMRNGEDYESILPTLNTATWVSFALVAASLVLTIIWMCSTSKDDGQTETYNQKLNEI